MKIRNMLVLIVGLAVILVGIQLSFTFGAGAGGALQQVLPVEGKSFGLLSAALAIGISSLGAGIAIYGATSAGAAAIAERPGTFVYILIFAGLGEGLAIYGLVVAIMILGKL